MTNPCGDIGSCQREPTTDRGYRCVCYPGVVDDGCVVLEHVRNVEMDEDGKYLHIPHN